MKMPIALAAMVLLVAACGDDDGAATAAPATSAPVTTTTEAPSTTQAPSTTTTEAPTTTADPIEELAGRVAEFEGGYEGTWNNTTFGSEGPITGNLSFDLAAMTISFESDLGGFVFGAQDPDPETLTIVLTDVEIGADGTLTATTTSAVFGEVQITVTETSIEMIADDVPDPGIASMVASGPFETDGFELTYVIEFAGGGDPAEGTVSVIKTG